MLSEPKGDTFSVSASGKIWKLSNGLHPLFELLVNNKVQKWRHIDDLVDKENIAEIIG